MLSLLLPRTTLYPPVLLSASFFLYGFPSFRKLTSFSNSKITYESWQRRERRKKCVSLMKVSCILTAIASRANSLAFTLFLFFCQPKLWPHKRLNKSEWFCISLNEVQKKRRKREKKKMRIFDIWLIMNVRCLNCSKLAQSERNAHAGTC